MIFLPVGKKYSKGFSLMELIIVLLMMGIFITVIFTLYDWHTKTYNYEQVLVKVSESGRNALQDMEFQITQAHRVMASSTISGVNYVSSSTTTVLQFYSLDSDNNMVNNQYDYAVFYLSGKKLYEKVVPNATSSRDSINKVLSDNVKSLSFAYSDPDFSAVKNVTVDITNEILNKGSSVNNTFHEKMYLRNY